MMCMSPAPTTTATAYLSPRPIKFVYLFVSCFPSLQPKHLDFLLKIATALFEFVKWDKILQSVL